MLSSLTYILLEAALIHYLPINWLCCILYLTKLKWYTQILICVMVLLCLVTTLPPCVCSAKAWLRPYLLRRFTDQAILFVLYLRHSIFEFPLKDFCLHLHKLHSTDWLPAHCKSFYACKWLLRYPQIVLSLRQYHTSIFI